MEKLWYNKEAKVWDEALPIGNARIGGMVFSDPICDRIQINEETLWSGCPDKESREHSLKELEKARKLLGEQKWIEGMRATEETMLDVYTDAYLTYGTLFFEITGSENKVENYRRELDMENGCVKTFYTYNGAKVEKTAFVSLADDVMVINIKSDNYLYMRAFQSVELEHSIKTNDSVITTCGRCPTKVLTHLRAVEYAEDKESVRFCSKLKAFSDHEVYGGGNILYMGGKNITLVFSIATSFNGCNKMPISEGLDEVKICEEKLEAACKYSFDELYTRHAREYAKYMNRVSLRIDGEDFSHLPTDERIKNYANGAVDNGIVTMLFDFARYISVASSLGSSQPSNLQGIWNMNMLPPWQCNYTMNINTQMNYWHVEACDLPECHEPLFKMLEELAEKGNHYGLRGWSSWHNSDLWRFNYEATKQALWGFWQLGGAWSVRHLWEHYLHTKDKDFLQKYYSIMCGAADFLCDWMYEDKDGYLTTGPSVSPENEFMVDGVRCSVCEGSAMDMQIIADLFDKTVKAGKLLGKDVAEYEKAIAKLKPTKIGDDGRILEWGIPLEERKLGHRHISHLYGFHPGNVIVDEPYVSAVRETLRVRLENGGGHTGWSNAWIANIYARLCDRAGFILCLRRMFEKSIYPNMFDAHPPFQIDGNFGICAAIIEALMQDYREDEVQYLPCLPSEWESGEARGFVNRLGEKVNFSWKNGKLINLEVSKNAVGK